MATNGVVYGDSLASGLASRLQTARSGDTWSEVSIPGLMLLEPSGGALGPGANSFTTAVHNVYYSSGARNVVAIFSILHGDCNDTFDTANQIFDRYRQLVLLAMGLGWEVCVATVIGTTEYNNPSSSPYRRPERIGVNQLLRFGDGGSRPIRANGAYLGDADAYPGLGQLDVPVSGPPGGNLISSDGIHLLNAGKDAVAGVFNTAIPLTRPKLTYNLLPKGSFLD